MKIERHSTKKVALTLATLFLAVNVCTVALADAVPGAVMILDASDNPDHPRAWKNLGEVGGSLSAADKAPELEEGPIKIARLGINERKAMYYTAKASRQTFGGPVNKNPKLFLADYTFEFLCKRNGNLFVEEHHFVGFQNSPAEGAQGIRFWLLGGGDELGISIHAKGSKQAPEAIKIRLEQDVWTWVTLVGENKKSIVAYQDGKEISKQGGFDWNVKLPINEISIGANSHSERRRTFNGSFALVRVYDKALTPAQVVQNARGVFLAVEPGDKLSTTWGKLKNGF